MKTIFTNPETWFGGFYELAIEIGPNSSQNLLQALQVLWSYPRLRGCYDSNKIEVEDQEKKNLVKIGLENWSHLYGKAILTNNDELCPCGVCIIQEESGSDWLDFYFPMGALDALFNTGNSFSKEYSKNVNSWQVEIDEWLKNLAFNIFSKVNFPLALIGLEVSGEAYYKDLIVNGIPEVRYFNYLIRKSKKLEEFKRNEQ